MKNLSTLPTRAELLALIQSDGDLHRAALPRLQFHRAYRELRDAGLIQRNFHDGPFWLLTESGEAKLLSVAGVVM